MATVSTRNPYLAGVQPEDNAAASFTNDRYFKLANNAKNWRLAFFAVLFCAGLFAAGLVYVTSKQQVVPYIVEVDAAGSARALAELRAQTVEDPLVIQALLRKWVQDIRTLTTDAEANHRRTQEAYGMALDSAQKTIGQYFREHPPEETTQRGRRFPVKITLQPVSARTWRVRWHEQFVSVEGQVMEDTEWEAVIEVALVMPTTSDERHRSPLGVWVATLQWNPV